MAKYLIIWAYLIISLKPTELQASQQAEPDSLVRYTLEPSLDGEGLKSLKITVRFEADASGRTEFGWASRWGGEPNLAQWTEGVTISGAGGLAKISGRSWIISSRPNADLIVSYYIALPSESDPSAADYDQARPVIRPDWFYAVGNAVFGSPIGDNKRQATFEWLGDASRLAFVSDLERPAISNEKFTLESMSSSILVA